MLKLHILLIFNIPLFVNVASETLLRVDPLVLINQGLVRGYKASDGDYSSFEGIPYAQVDLNYPFGPALQAPQFEEDIYNANDKSIRCPQSSEKNVNETLDCLRLNVYVPNSASRTNPLPVFVWIHGGGFKGGSGSEPNPKDIVRHGVIVVTLNYRLGVYGFMCLGVPSLPGNQGLKDQYEALLWVRNNIAAFGGNPNNVTLGGQSAGSCSVFLQLFSSKEKLFHKVILESGTPLSYGMFVEGDETAAVKLAQLLGLSTEDTEIAIQYLTTVSSELVVAAAANLSLDLKPCKERSFSGVDNFVEYYPPLLTNSAKIRNTPVLIGHTSIEEIGYSANANKDSFTTVIQGHFDLDDSNLEEAVNYVEHFYIGDLPSTDNISLQVANFNSDFVFNHPVQRIIDKLLQEGAGNIYQYVFSYVGDSGKAGAGHSSELQYLLHMDDFGVFPINDLLLERMTTLWTNFIKFGNPTPAVSDLLPVTWMPVDSDKRPYLELNEELLLKSRVYQDRMAFWDLFYKVYGNNQRLSRNCNV